MKSFAFDSIQRAILYIGLFILTGILIPLSLVRLIDINPWMLMLQGAISGLLLCSISILLEFVTRYT
ncbi:MAG: hypothetical protein Q8914_13815, partial [Bacteroidota bacterium]|nr:hypothetical protein [Bacteroidota bacterium]